MIGKTISHYKILEKLGEGGMGVVYKAEDTKLDRFVALKFLPLHLSQSAEEKKRFIHEAKAASALDHHNICNIHEIDETDDGQVFIVMALYEGTTLKKKIDEGHFSIEEAIDIAAQIATGLAKAHETGIVHRDIKPANIMIIDDGVVKILDFGLAKLRGQSRLTKAGSTLGTAAYMSPEQAKGVEVDARADIFSLGAVFYEMLTGQIPFKGDYDQAVIYSLLNEEPEPIPEIRAHVPRNVENVVKKCLEKETDDRYQTASELLTDLTRGAAPKKLVTPKVLQRRQFMGLALFSLAIVLAGIGYISFFNKTPEPPINSIAVLPFVNSSNDPAIEYLSDGITETLITKLSQLPQLKVMARSTVFRFKGTDMTPQQVGEQLNVQAVLMGEIVQRDDVLRLVAELVDVSDGTQIWGDQYNRSMDDIFVVQDAISEQISTSLRLKLSSEDKSRLVKRHTEDTEAYELYLKGRFYWNQRTVDALNTALEYFQQAINRDPTYALAYAGIADCYVILPWYRGLTAIESFPKAKAAALKALQLDEKLAEAHTALALTYVVFDWDWVSAEKSFVRAIELNPNYATAHHWYGISITYWSGLTRVDEAIAELKRALALDPLSLIIKAELGTVYYQAGYNDLAIDQLRNAIEMDEHFYVAHYYLGTAYIFNGEISKGTEELRHAMRLDDDPKTVAAMGYVYGISGKIEEAEKTLAHLKELSAKRVVSPYDYATISAGLGDKEKTLELLQQCLEQREWLLVFLKVDRFWDNLRDDPRFIELLKKVGFEK